MMRFCRAVVAVFLWAVLVLGPGERVRVWADGGCPLDHFSIGQLGGRGSSTGRLFADVETLYRATERKPYAGCYPLQESLYGGYVNGEPGSNLLTGDPEHELAGTPLVDYDIWLEVVELSPDFYVGYQGTWYVQGDRVHLSEVPGHHLHMDYWVFLEDYAPDRLYYVIYRLLDELDDGQRYQPSEEFWVVFNRPVPGDFNDDGHIDLYDFSRFQTAFSPTAPDHQMADLDGDGGVDLDDYTAWQACLAGPGGHPDPRCAK